MDDTNTLTEAATTKQISRGERFVFTLIVLGVIAAIAAALGAIPFALRIDLGHYRADVEAAGYDVVAAQTLFLTPMVTVDLDGELVDVYRVGDAFVVDNPPGYDEGARVTLDRYVEDRYANR